MNKLQKNQDKAFIEWIKSRPCYFGGKFIEERGYPMFCKQDWNMESGEFRSDPSHIMKRGSTRRNEHIGNLFPNCRRHHVWFESCTPGYRVKFKDVGLRYWQEFKNDRN